MIGGIIITRREVITVTRRDHLCTFMKHEEFGNHEFYCIQRWVRVIREGRDTHMFKDSEEKYEEESLWSNLIPVRLLFLKLI